MPAPRTPQPDRRHGLRGNPRVNRAITGTQAIAAYAVIAVLAACILLMKGAGGPLPARLVGVISVTVQSGWPPMLYLLGSLGLGRITRPWLGSTKAQWVIELGVGFTLCLTLTHLLGMTGLLNPYTAWLITAAGILALLIDARRHRTQLTAAIENIRLSIPGAAVVIGAVLVVLMSSNPPGTLWDSEYGGYDALSYHLQLPREWVAQGHIWPSEHNVYSFLPGYIEAAYAHMAHMTGGNLTDHNARIAMSAHLFSAGMLIAAAMAIGTLTRGVIARFIPDADSHAAAHLARALTLGTPWLVVVGSLAYNEMGVVLLGIAALAAAAETSIAPPRRAMLTALILAGACSCKPTALFLLAPGVGIVLLAAMPPRRWIPAVLLGSVVGAITLAPWLIRNELATGNPVFPQLAAVFGQGHWTPAQHEIYAQAHRFAGTPLDRIGLLVLPDAGGNDHVSRFRGLTNLQWGLTPLLALIGLGLLTFRRSLRRLGLVAALAIAGPLVAWMVLTHLQSRFLVPLAPLLIVAAAAALATIPSEIPRRGLMRTLAVFAVGWSVLIALAQSGGNPFMAVDLGPAAFTGELEINDPPWTATINRAARPGETIYLLGDATPFYVRSPVEYNTVYDRWLIEEAIAADPGDPAAWTEELRERGIDIVVISFTEIDRFARSGWLPPTIDPDQVIAWIETLGRPIEVWEDPATGAPIRAAFRISEQP